ncbi:YceI family protein [Humibacter sp. BT305]|nr:YceI family protein [Humibacter sp. BT305]
MPRPLPAPAHVGLVDFPRTDPREVLLRNTTRMTVVALTGVFAVGVVVVVAAPILSSSLASSSPASVQGVVPTVVGTDQSDDDVAPVAADAPVWTLGSGSSVRFRVVDSDDDDVISSAATDIAGSLTLADGVLSQAEFVVDLASTPIESARADDGLMSALAAAASGNPMATFVLTAPASVGAGDGTYTTPLVGTLTVSGKAIPVSAVAEVTIDGSSGSLVASIPMELSDYGVPAANGASAYFDMTLTLADAN